MVTGTGIGDGDEEAEGELLDDEDCEPRPRL